MLKNHLCCIYTSGGALFNTDVGDWSLLLFSVVFCCFDALPWVKVKVEVHTLDIASL